MSSPSATGVGGAGVPAFSAASVSSEEGPLGLYPICCCRTTMSRGLTTVMVGVPFDPPIMVPAGSETTATFCRLKLFFHSSALPFNNSVATPTL